MPLSQLQVTVSPSLNSNLAAGPYLGRRAIKSRVPTATWSISPLGAADRVIAVTRNNSPLEAADRMIALNVVEVIGEYNTLSVKGSKNFFGVNGCTGMGNTRNRVGRKRRNKIGRCFCKGILDSSRQVG